MEEILMLMLLLPQILQERRGDNIVQERRNWSRSPNSQRRILVIGSRFVVIIPKGRYLCQIVESQLMQSRISGMRRNERGVFRIKYVQLLWREDIHPIILNDRTYREKIKMLQTSCILLAWRRWSCWMWRGEEAVQRIQLMIVNITY